MNKEFEDDILLSYMNFCEALDGDKLSEEDVRIFAFSHMKLNTIVHQEMGKSDEEIIDSSLKFYLFCSDIIKNNIN